MRTVTAEASMADTYPTTTTTTEMACLFAIIINLQRIRQIVPTTRAPPTFDVAVALEFVRFARRFLSPDSVVVILHTRSNIVIIYLYTNI